MSLAFNKAEGHNKHLSKSFMENGLYIGLSRQIGLRQQLDVVANNLANSNTGGYRSDRVAFHDLLVRTDATAKSGELAFSEAVNISRDPSRGRHTDYG